MNKNIIKQSFAFSEEMLAKRFGDKAVVVAILESDIDNFNAGSEGFEVLDTVPLIELAGEVKRVMAIKWEDGITRTQHIVGRVINPEIKAVVAIPLSQVA